MGEDLPLLIEQHPAVGTGFQEANSVVLGESPVLTSFDHLEMPQPDRDQKKSNSQDYEEGIIPSLKLVHFLGIQFHRGLSFSSSRQRVFREQEMDRLAKHEEQEGCDQGRTKGLRKKMGEHRWKKIA